MQVANVPEILFKPVYFRAKETHPSPEIYMIQLLAKTLGCMASFSLLYLERFALRDRI